MRPPADAEILLRRYLRDGRLTSLPRPGRKRDVVLEHLAQRFEPGRHYRETEVNASLREVWPDVAALRRYLVEGGFLDRTPDGVYWRSGGRVDV